MKEKIIDEIEFGQILRSMGERGLFDGRVPGVRIGLRVSYAFALNADEQYIKYNCHNGDYDSMGIRFRLIPHSGTSGISIED